MCSINRIILNNKYYNMLRHWMECDFKKKFTNRSIQSNPHLCIPTFIPN